jgi:hypothetical protein
MSMIPQNVVNTEKKGNIEGRVFHLFYPNLSTAFLFDKDLKEPIIFGSKTIVMTWTKKLDELMEVPNTTNVRIYSYILGQDGYRRIDTYNGPIETIGKYIRRC